MANVPEGKEGDRTPVLKQIYKARLICVSNTSSRITIKILFIINRLNPNNTTTSKERKTVKKTSLLRFKSSIETACVIRINRKFSQLQKYCIVYVPRLIRKHEVQNDTGDFLCLLPGACGFPEQIVIERLDINLGKGLSLYEARSQCLSSSD